MKTRIKKLYDVDLIPTPEDTAQWRVSEEEAGELTESLGAEYPTETEVERSAAGDTVFCRCEGALSDRTVLIFPGRSVPDAEKAEMAVVGAAVGDTVRTSIAGGDVSLTVERIVRREPATVDDALVASLGIEGVTTKDGYRKYIKEKTEADRMSIAAKHLSAQLREELINRSEYDLDEAERDAWTSKAAREVFDQCLQEGYDPRIPDEGTDFLTDEEAIERFKQQLEPQYLSMAMSRALCEANGVVPTPEDIQEFRDGGVPEEEIEDRFYDNRAWDVLYRVAQARLEGQK